MKQFTALIRNQFNFTVRTYRSDEGGEYNDRELLKTLRIWELIFNKAFHMLANKMVVLRLRIFKG